MARRPCMSALSFPNGNLNSRVTSVAKQKCLCLLDSCSSMKQLSQIFAFTQTSGLFFDIDVAGEIIRLCSLNPFKSLCFAQAILRRTENPSVWNYIIRHCATKDLPLDALLIFSSMRQMGVRPNKHTFPFIIKSYAALAMLKEGQQVQGDIVKHGLDANVYVQNTLIHFYGTCGDIAHAHKVFVEMSVRTVVSWNSIIGACVENSQFGEAIRHFVLLRVEGKFEPDETTMVSLLSACAEMGHLSLGKWVHCQVEQKGLNINCQLGTALVDMYAKCGALNYARIVFDRMHERNVLTWSAMILGLAQHGLGAEALKLFGRMKVANIKPNYVTFLGVLCACCHCGLVDQGYRFFYEMEHVYGIKPLMIHYGAMVDTLGRAGLVKEAYNFIINMQVVPHAVIWRTLLSACNIHDADGHTGVAEIVKKRLLELEPRRSGNLVMVSNMFSEVGMFEEATKLRNRSNMRKMAGESSVEVGCSVYRFISGDDVLVDSEAIYLLLDRLKLHMKMLAENEWLN